MSANFKYDIKQLITCVRNAPCLWDKTCENYKDHLERRMAWEEIYRTLDPDYEDMSSEDKQVLGSQIVTKWTNIRDTFVKTLKSKNGKPKRKYIYHNELKFLTKCILPMDESSFAESTDQSDTFSFTIKSDSEAEPSSSKRVKKKKREYQDYTETREEDSFVDDDRSKFDFVKVDEVTGTRLMNEDEAFFASLLPSVVKYNEDEKLSFRMDVLAAMKKIKDNRWYSEDSK